MRAWLYLQVPEVERVGGQLMPSSSSVLSENTESEAFDIQTLYQRGKESFDVIPGRADTPKSEISWVHIATYPYAIKNQRKARNAPSRSISSQSRGFGCL